MAYDPQARQQSNSAMIIGVVALVLLVIGAIAYFSTQNTQADPTTHTTVITPPSERVETQVVPVPNSAPPVVIERSAPAAPAAATTRTIERDSHTTVTRDRTDTAPATSSDTTTTTTTTSP